MCQGKIYIIEMLDIASTLLNTVNDHPSSIMQGVLFNEVII